MDGTLGAEITTLLRVRGVSKSYLLGEEMILALNRVSVDLREAEFVGLSGPSGSGKSTLLNIIGALDEPDEGEITYRGERMDYCNLRLVEGFRRFEVGFIFQHFNLVPVLTALENVGIALINHGLTEAQVAERARATLDAVGLDAHRDKFPRHLSGGQQQRVAVARALVKRPKMILADEPTASLDGANAQHLVELMSLLSREYQTAFIVSTHDQRLLNLLPRIIKMEDGVVLS